MKLSQANQINRMHDIICDLSHVINTMEKKVRITHDDYEETPVIKLGDFWPYDEEDKAIHNEAEKELIIDIKNALIKYRKCLIKYIENFGVECDVNI